MRVVGHRIVDRVRRAKGREADCSPEPRAAPAEPEGGERDRCDIGEQEDVADRAHGFREHNARRVQQGRGGDPQP